ncbi:TPA_exp: Histone-lysine N-methyltransferase Clr4 [Trichophyton benhamiae CBS 112371]|uniref:Histone-lysine N-methyltransferase Clr4 n=1 Tax=Arthroderma benhamiae (strain ATCC MYA-4681 / CBS 112371) TaxID=663331 RepID=D4B2Y3_ARTBC|nr:histone-lysine N-methyltransferase Clr4 [Trichophyton benhamiae CBS 112371]EFE30279.1 histone-lysine N-methyltransferase Clr4 [Trichophyton benhamiae CBS 112371]DAA73498.1 TPA_exp: Histone-lysine N-methyltransferase Clr4 [Trichophyton benhamiae CBS 112371]
MVTVLDSDSDEETFIQPEVISSRLLKAFISPEDDRQRQSPSKPPSKPRRAVVDKGSTSSSSRPQSKASNVSVVIPVPPRRPSPSPVTTSRKRSLSSDGDINKALSRKLTATKIPDHHGLSDFYAVESGEVKRPYLKLKTFDPKKTEIPRSSKRYIPPKRRSDKESACSRLEELYNKKLQRIKGPPIRFKAGKIAKEIDFNFDFIDSYKIHSGVNQIDPEFLWGCDCTKCDAECDCLSKDLVHYEKGRRVRAVLKSEILNKRTALIRECSSRCKCSGVNCWNHVVFRGRQVELEVFQTKNRGFGVRSPHSIERGQFIDTYVGEVIEPSTSDAREEAIDVEKYSSYLFSLDYFPGEEYEKEKDIYVVDGRKFGSITRFMNHSCNPNCKMFPATQTDDHGVYQLAFFAVRDIPAGTELTFDYHPGWEGGDVDPDATKCLCGEKNCRGQLWPAKRKTTRPGEDSSSSGESSEESEDDE